MVVVLVVVLVLMLVLGWRVGIDLAMIVDDGDGFPLILRQS